MKSRPSYLAWLMIVSAARASATDPTFFSEKLYPVLEAAQCRICHARDTPEPGLVAYTAAS